MMTVDDFLELRWRSLPDEEFTVEVMSFAGNRFEVRHVSADHHVGYINGIPVGAADNMERAVRLIYAKWNRQMTDDEIRDALVTLKRRTLNVAPLEMTAGRHVALIELIIDSEALLRGFAPQRPRASIEADIRQALAVE